MDFDTYLRFALALVLVLGLIGLAAWLARRFGMAGRVRVSGAKPGKRLAIAEVLSLDNKRRMVLVRRDEAEHLIILGPSSETVVERGIGTSHRGFRDALDAADRDEADDA